MSHGRENEFSSRVRIRYKECKWFLNLVLNCVSLLYHVSAKVVETLRSRIGYWNGGTPTAKIALLYTHFRTGGLKPPQPLTGEEKRSETLNCRPHYCRKQNYIRAGISLATPEHAWRKRSIHLEKKLMLARRVFGFNVTHNGHAESEKKQPSEPKEIGNSRLD